MKTFDDFRRVAARVVVVIAAVASFCSQAAAADFLKASPNNRYLVYESGQPFFYLGDTAWELFHRLNREEADKYLSDRARKRFTVIQAVVLAELEGLTVTNAYGELPLKDNDPGQPNEAYFKHVDYIVEGAESRGMFVGMLPAWGDKWNKRWGVGPEVFTPSNAKRFGRFLGERYKDNQIIWILGGDRNPEEEEDLEIIRAMAEGLEEGHGGKQLMTYHPMGGSNSAKWFHEDEWLDFNMYQSGHSKPDNANYAVTQNLYALDPIKPVLDGEPRYEDHPIDWNPDKGWFNEFDTRQAAYWSMLAGACGHTYGNHNIWQMWTRERQPISSARTPWPAAMEHPGATQVGYMRKLFESRPYQRLVPDQSLTDGDGGEGAGHIRAARERDGAFAFIYTPLGRPVRVNLDKLSGEQVKVWWFDPRNSNAAEVGVLESSGVREFEPFSSGRGNDWVLVLDDVAREFAQPAVVKYQE